MNPRIQVSISRTFEAEHALPRVGAAERHKHAYAMECGYTREIDSDLGCTRRMQDLNKEIDHIVSRIEGRYLNDFLPAPPTAEVLACWILAQLGAHWEWVAIRAYDGFMCRVDREQLSPWLSKLRGPASASS